MLRNKGGFTLIELVMIIVILGILAAVAIPRFTDLSRDARQSACDGYIGGIRSGISIDWASALLSKTVAYNGGTPYGTGLDSFTEALDTLEAGTTLPSYLLATSGTVRNCDLDNDGTGAETGEITYTLIPATGGATPTVAYVLRSVN